MKTCVLQRNTDDGKSCLGTLSMPSGIIYQTVERPWKGNMNNISCIPAGEYVCTVTMSKRFQKRLYLVKDVPGRSGIRIHAANYAAQLEGCIAPGVASIVGGVAASAIAVSRIMNELEEKDFILKVVDVPKHK